MYTKEQVLAFGAYVLTHERVKAAKNQPDIEDNLSVAELLEKFDGPCECNPVSESESSANDPAEHSEISDSSVDAEGNIDTTQAI